MNATNMLLPVLAETKEHLSVKRSCRRDVSSYTIHLEFTKIVEEWTSHLQYVSWKITRDKQVSEDIVQEAFLQLWLQRNKIIPENPVGWLLSVVANLSNKHVRRAMVQNRIYKTLSYNHQPFYSDVEERLTGKEISVRWNNIFNKLPSRQQIVLHLSKEKGLQRQEIAARLQLSPNTVKVHLLRATQFMKEHLACILLFLLFFLFNNIFSKRSNTNDRIKELFKTEQVLQKQLPEKISMELVKR